MKLQVTVSWARNGIVTSITTLGEEAKGLRTLLGMQKTILGLNLE